MAAGVKPRVKMPERAAAGAVITIRTLISHRMESGQRRDAEGRLVPRSIIHRFRVVFVGADGGVQPVIDIDMGPGISTNPYFEFDTPLPGTGRFSFTWYDDDGAVYALDRDVQAE